MRLIEDAGILEGTKEKLLTRDEVIANTFVIMFAGHETTANALHFAMIFLALRPDFQRRLQEDLDVLIDGKPPSHWDFKADFDRLFASSLGAVINEGLRLIPAVIAIPKEVKAGAGDQVLSVDGREIIVPEGSFVHMNAFGVHRNPRYWKHGPSKRTSAATDLNDFVPERWLPDAYTASAEHKAGSKTLYTPPRGAFLAFSEGARACLGRRFALVELTAVLAAVFSRYSVELAVDEWADGEDVQRMGKKRKEAVYAKAADAAWHKLDFELESLATLQLPTSKAVALRIVKR